MDGVTIPEGRSGGVDAALGQPRRRGLRRPVHVRHRPHRQSRTSPSAEAVRTTVSARCWPAPRSALCSTNCSAAPTTSRSARPRSPIPNLTQQHVDLRRDGDLPDASLSHNPFGLVPITPSAASRSRSASVSPHSSVSTSRVVLTQCRRRCGAATCRRRRAGRTADIGYRPAPVRDVRGVRRSRDVSVAGSRSPATANHHGRRNPRAREALDHGVGILGGEPFVQGRAPSRPSASANASHSVVGSARHRDPVVVAGASVEVLRRTPGGRGCRAAREIDPKTSNSIVCTAVTLSTVSIIGTSTS